MADEVILLDFQFSPFATRVRIALNEKCIPFESREQNLFNKSSFLLEMNPVNKKVPVLIHNGKPICESLIILQYIDEVWKDKSPLLPTDPYERANAKFWADYIDNKVYGFARSVWSTKGETLEVAKKELINSLKLLEAELGDKSYFGGNNFGITDIALVPFYGFFYTLEKFGNFNINDECPKLVAWGKRCTERESVAKSLYDQSDAYGFILDLNKMLGIN